MLRRNAAFLKQRPNIRFTIDGHEDEKGTPQINPPIGLRRAEAAWENVALPHFGASGQDQDAALASAGG